jgi:hypothetical protein
MRKEISMSRSQKVKGEGGLRNQRIFASRSHEARLRSTVIKLEALEERTLLSTTAKVLPTTANVPVGLGATYTALSRAAHGLVPVTGSPVTMSDLEAYLKRLGASLPKDLGPANSASSPTNFRNQPGAPQNPNGGAIEALAQDPLLTGLSATPLLPTTVSGFDGMNFLDSVDGYVPPSTSIGVGPQYVVETVNAQIQIYSKATGAAQLPNTPLATFFGQPSESPFDPVVTYDDISNRFIVAAATFSGHLLLAVSNDSNPLDGFSADYDIDVSEGAGFFGDLPKIGWNHDEVVITENMYGPSNFDHVQVLSFAASSIFAQNPPAVLAPGTDYFSYNRTNNDFTLVPATMHGAAAGTPMYFVEENSYGDGANLRVVSATNLWVTRPASPTRSSRSRHILSRRRWFSLAA